MNQKDTVRAFINALGQGDADTLKNLLTDDVEAICTGTSVLSGSRDLNTILQTAAAFPQLARHGIEFTILELTEEANRVACEMTGVGEFVNGAIYRNEYHFLFYFRDGKISKFKEYLDTKMVDEVLAPLLAGGC